MGYICPVCGYENLKEAPYNSLGYGSYEICICCRFQFGNNDFSNKETAINVWRKNWIKAGSKWGSKRKNPPLNWDPEEQVKKVL